MSFDAVQPYVTVTVNLAAGESLPSSLGSLIVLEHSYWGDRVRPLSLGSAEDTIAEMVTLGLAEGDELYQALWEVLQQPRRPSVVYIGRRAPGDPTWAAALDACAAASDAWLYVAPLTRDPTEILEISEWVLLRGRGAALALTNNAGVYAESPGNLAESLNALSGPSAALLWHDAQVASQAAAPTARTSRGPWALKPGGTLSLIPDGGTPETFTLTCAPAVVTGSNAGPFVGADGQVFTGSVDGAPFTATLTGAPATVTAITAETYDLSSAPSITVETDTGTTTYVFGSGAAPANMAAVTATEVRDDFLAAVPAAQALATAAGGVPTFRSATEGSAARFRFTPATGAVFLAALGLPGGGLTYVGAGNVPDLSAYTAAELASLVQEDIGINGTAEETATDEIRLTSGIAGTSGDVTIGAGSTAGLLTALGLSAGSTSGTGVVANASNVTAIELEPLLVAAYTSVGVFAVEANTALDLVSNLGVGRWHSLRFTGELRSELGLTAGLVRGAGVERDYANVSLLAQMLGINLDVAPPTGGLLPLNNIAIVGSAQGDVIPRPKSASLRRTANVNTLERVRNARRGPEVHDGRVCWLLEGTPVYFETLIARDWLAIRLQTAIKEALDQASDQNIPVGTTTPEMQAFFMGPVGQVLSTAFDTRKIEKPDLTPPDPTSGKVTGVRVVARPDLSAEQRTLRLGEVQIVQRMAASLGGAVVKVTFINA